MLSTSIFRRRRHETTTSNLQIQTSSLPSPRSTHYNCLHLQRNICRMSRRDLRNKTPLTVGAVNIDGLSYQSAWAIQRYLDSHKYDVFAVSETHFREGVLHDPVEYPG